MLLQAESVQTHFDLAATTLTRNGGENFLMHPKTWCLNFKPQYLQNYSSPTNDLYNVRKRSSRAFKSIFKLLGWVSARAGSLRSKFFARSPALVCGVAALAPDFAPKLCTPCVFDCISACFKTCKGPFDLILSPVL